ncbi:MAG: hypothetical protein ACLSDQ_14435 [Adlercreutzia equolifaciens]
MSGTWTTGGTSTTEGTDTLAALAATNTSPQFSQNAASSDYRMSSGGISSTFSSLIAQMKRIVPDYFFKNFLTQQQLNYWFA